MVCRMEYARVSGSPGERPRFAGLVRVTWPLFLVLAATGYLVRAALPLPALAPAHVGVLFLLLAVGLAAAVNAGRRRLPSFLKGARGEEWVARQLAFLPAGYHVFHGVTLAPAAVMPNRGDLDHVVIGPSGVFVIETKNWAGAITVEGDTILYNGQAPSRPPLDQARQAAERTARHLHAACGRPVPVHPVVCFAANTLVGGQHGIGGVIVCNACDLNALVLQPDHPPLSPALIDTLANALKVDVDSG